jgi:hypothetical protein
VNRDTPNTFLRGVVTVLAGAVILYAIGCYLGWWVAGTIAVAGLADTAWCAIQLLPWRTR